MPRSRNDFLSAITGGNQPGIASAAGAAKAAKRAGVAAPAFDGATVLGATAPEGIVIPDLGTTLPGADATPAQIAEWRARFGVEALQPSYGPAGESGRLNVLTLFAQEWKAIMVDRPTILKSANADLTGLVYYAPDTKLPADLVAHVQRSTGAGIVYLPQKGTWWVYYNGTAATQTDWTQIDATDPIVAARYTSEQGAQYWSANTVTAPATGAGSIELVPANRDRRGLLIQNLDGALPILYRFVPGTSLPNLALAAGSSSWRILQNSEMFLTGDQSARQRIVTQSTGAAALTIAVQMF